jgi:four helix bundle protein
MEITKAHQFRTPLNRKITGGAMDTKPHKKLEAWKQGVDLTVQTYRLTEKLPSEKRFGLAAQMRRAAVSVPSNVAEGAAKNTKKEFIQFLHTAQGSLAELDTQFVICERLGYLAGIDLGRFYGEIERESKLITGLIKYLKKNR